MAAELARQMAGERRSAAAQRFLDFESTMQDATTTRQLLVPLNNTVARGLAGAPIAPSDFRPAAGATVWRGSRAKSAPPYLPPAATSCSLPPLRRPPSARRRLPPTAMRAAAGPTKAPFAWPLGLVESEDTTGSMSAGTALPSFMPLADFFDTDADPCSAQEFAAWKATGRDVHGASRWMLPGGETEWRPCAVLDYDVAMQQYLIEWDCNGKTKYVGRLNLIFDAENRAAYESTLDKARETRAMVESEMRYAHRVQAMGFATQGTHVPAATEERICHRIGVVAHRGGRWAPKIRAVNVLTPLQMDVLGSLLTEVATINATALNKVEFDIRRRDTASSSVFRNLPMAMGAGPWDMPLDDLLRSVGGAECLAPFQDRVAALESLWPNGNANISTAAARVWIAIQRLSALRMMQTDFEMPSCLRDAVQMQAEARADVNSELRTFIRFELPDIVEDALSKEEMDADRATEARMLRAYRQFQGTCRQMLRVCTLAILDKGVADFTSIFLADPAAQQRGESMFPPAVFAVEFVADYAGGCIVPSTPLDSYRASMVDAVKESGRGLLWTQDVDLKFLSQAGAQSESVSTLHSQPERYMHMLQQASERIGNAVDAQVTLVEAFMQDTLRPFEDLLKRDASKYKLELEAEMAAGDAPAICQKHLQIYDSATASIDATLGGQCRTFLFEMRVERLRSQLLKTCKILRCAVVACLRTVTNMRISSIETTIAAIQVKISKSIQSPEHYQEIREYIDSMLENSQSIPDIQPVMDGFDMLQELCVECSTAEISRKWTVFKMVNDVRQQLSSRKRDLFKDASRLLEALEATEAKLQKRGRQLTSRIGEFDETCNLTRIEESDPSILGTMRADLLHLAETDRRCRSHRAILCDTGASGLKSLLMQDLRNYEPRVQLWNQASAWFDNFHAWMATPFNQLNAAKMQRKVDKFVVDCEKLIVEMGEVNLDVDQSALPGSHPVSIAFGLRDRVQHLNAEMPFISRLRHAGIRSRHWREIEDLIGFDVRPVLDLAVKDVLAMDFAGKKDALGAILTRALSEYALEFSLDTMVSQLDSMQFIVEAFQDKQIVEQVSTERILEIIDEQYVEVQKLMLSPHKGPFVTRSTDWIEYLQDLNSFVDLLMACQSKYLYNLPIFTAGDVAKLIPQEAQRFRSVDAHMQHVVHALVTDSYLVHVPPRPELRERLEQCMELFGQLKTGMSTLLDAKRQNFARLYFMSDRDILDMMSQSATAPHLLGSYVHKCFDGVFNFVLSRRKDSIEALCSKESEQVYLSKPIVFQNIVAEVWMSALEQEMRHTLELVTRQAVQSIREIASERRLFDWPIECALLAHEVYFASDTEKCIRARKPHMLRASYDSLVEKVGIFSRELNLQPSKSSLSPLQRTARTAQLLLLLRFRDTLSDLISADVSAVEDFSWTSNLRYYVLPDQVVADCCFYRAQYGFEYLGGKSRLVMTDKIKRAVCTIVGALHYNLGAAIIGQPGCGKTQTSEDVAASLGRPFIFFNCEHELSYRVLSNLLKGVASTGAWICLDNFDMLSSEAISLVAQQVLDIQRAAAAGEKNVKLGDLAVPLNTMCAVTITLDDTTWINGRIPDNVKALFRPCTLGNIRGRNMVTVCEARLISAGFENAYKLASTLDCILRLLESQLTWQRHYSFSVWSAMAVITRMVDLRNMELNKVAASSDAPDESALLQHAINHCVLPALCACDISTFQRLMSEVRSLLLPCLMRFEMY